MTSNKTRVFNIAVKWAMISNIGREGITALTSFILAFLLGPNEFGIVAIALVFITFIQIFIDSGFNDAIIQKTDISKTHLDSIFWLIIVSSILLAGICIAFSKLWAKINNINELFLVLSALSITIPIKGLILVQQAILHKNLDFRIIAIRDNVSVILGGCVGVGMAYSGFGVWALVAQHIIRGIVELVVVWTLSKWRPSLKFSMKHVKDVFGFTLKVFIGRLGIFLQGQSDVLLMGIFFGPTAVGLYRFAHRIMNMILNIVTRALHNVSFPFFSKVQEDRLELEKALIYCWKVSAIMTIPAMMGIAAASEVIMAVVGPQWEAAAKVLKILCIIGITKAITLFTGTFLKAISKPGLGSLLIWSSAGFSTIVFVIVGILARDMDVEQQVIWIAISRSSLFVLFLLPMNILFILRFGKIKLRKLFDTIITSIITGIVIYFTITGLNLYVDIDIKPIYLFGFYMGLIIFISIVMLLLIDQKFRSFMFTIIRKTVKIDSV